MGVIIYAFWKSQKITICINFDSWITRVCSPPNPSVYLSMPTDRRLISSIRKRPSSRTSHHLSLLFIPFSIFKDSFFFYTNNNKREARLTFGFECVYISLREKKTEENRLRWKLVDDHDQSWTHGMQSVIRIWFFSLYAFSINQESRPRPTPSSVLFLSKLTIYYNSCIHIN